MAEWVQKGLHTVASQSTKDNDDEILSKIIDKLNKLTESRANRIVHYRGGSATASIPGSNKKVSYTAPKDKNGKPKYRPTKEIFKVEECMLLMKEQKEKKKEKGKIPKWIEIAITEEEKGISEYDNCKYIIDTYHNSTDNTKMSRCGKEKDIKAGNHEWCAAFVNYCLKTAGYKTQNDPGARWYKEVNKVERIKGQGPSLTQEIWAKKYTTMYMGGIIVWASNSHTAFIIGIDKSNSNNYIILGGNQNDSVQYWTAPKTKIHPFCLFPDDYEGELIPLKEIEPNDLRKGAQKHKEGSAR
jgi:hypothetical protein